MLKKKHQKVVMDMLDIILSLYMQCSARCHATLEENRNMTQK